MSNRKRREKKVQVKQPVFISEERGVNRSTNAPKHLHNKLMANVNEDTIRREPSEFSFACER